jgi:glycosyltransferase involved in cell wall biosynthesis
MPRPIILTSVGGYLPGYKSGGPLQTIVNMVEQLGDDLDFRIITADRDLGDVQPYANVVIDGWNKVGKSQVFYASPKNRSIRAWARLISDTPHDVLYLNSFLSPFFTIRPLLARRLGLIPRRPVVLAPRGEFSKGAFALKRWKKEPYILAAKIFGLYRDITWQASSKYESDDIQRVLGGKAKSIVIAPIVIAPDLPNISLVVSDEALEKTNATSKVLRVCFLSRISPMKNLDYALRILSEVSVPVEFDIYGVIEDEAYWKDCQKIIKGLPSHVVVRSHGRIEHSHVVRVLSQYDLFFLPTRGENFGHVIHEALSAGLPVLISDQTPWRNLEALGVGWDLPLSDAHKFRAAIETQAAMKGSEARVVQRHLTKQHARRIATDKKVISENLRLFLDLIDEKNSE